MFLSLIAYLFADGRWKIMWASVISNYVFFTFLSVLVGPMFLHLTYVGPVHCVIQRFSQSLSMWTDTTKVGTCVQGKPQHACLRSCKHTNTHNTYWYICIYTGGRTSRSTLNFGRETGYLE